jgi:UDP-N-acetylmuramoylalanine--D-glutamate ligase
VLTGRTGHAETTLRHFSIHPSTITLNAPDYIRSLLTHPVAIFGGGLSGRALVELVARLGAKGMVFDCTPGAGDFSDFTAADATAHRLVLFSPGFTPTHPWLSAARSAGALCLGELDFASLFWRGPFVAITGTNGKTTLTEFLTHALRIAGHDATATGNIGYPLSQLVVDRDGGAPDAYALCEVSSFQAETLRHFRADSALWTNFAEDHLERHGTMESYFMAKWRLLERSIGGRIYAGGSVQRFALQYGQTLPPDACVASENQAGDVLLQGTVFADYPQRENFLLAAAWWRDAGLLESVLYSAARSFQPARHRLEKVGEFAGVTWWNDSKATNFHATEAALSRFQVPVLLVAGGKSKGGDLHGFVQRIAPKVRHVALIGETRHVLATFCGAEGVSYTLGNNLADAVQALGALAQPGDNILLSPGFASFDQFNSYADRGDQFVALARAYTGNPLSTAL